MNSRIICSLLAGVIAMPISYAVKAGEFSVDSGKRQLTIGIAALYKDKPYQDYDSSEKTSGIPIVLYEGEQFFARGGNIGWDFLNSDVVEVAVIGQFLGDGYDESDSRILKGNGDKDPSFGVGGQVIWKPENFGFKLSVVQDVTDNSDGAQAVGGVFYSYKASPWMITPSASVVWQSDDYNDYYYGVKSRAKNANAYSASSDINYRFGIFAAYQQPTSNWMFMGGLRYEIFGDEITDSTIVSEDEQLSALIGVAYTFK